VANDTLTLTIKRLIYYCFETNIFVNKLKYEGMNENMNYTIYVRNNILRNSFNIRRQDCVLEASPNFLRKTSRVVKMYHAVELRH